MDNLLKLVYFLKPCLGQSFYLTRSETWSAIRRPSAHSLQLAEWMRRNWSNGSARCASKPSLPSSGSGGKVGRLVLGSLTIPCGFGSNGEAAGDGQARAATDSTIAPETRC